MKRRSKAATIQIPKPHPSSYHGTVYAVIFENGIAKVGASNSTAKDRISEHVNLGKKFLIDVAYILRFETKDYLFELESSLHQKCLLVAKNTFKTEWFKFESANSARHIIQKHAEELLLTEPWKNRGAK